MVARWTIVMFLHDKTVEAVPSHWIEDNFCFWPTPPFPRLATALKKCVPVNPAWTKYEISIFANAIFDDYAKARTKAREAEETSDLQSDKEMTGKRKRIQKYVSSSNSESEEEIHLPKAPKIKKVEKFDKSINILREDKDKENNEVREQTHIAIEDVHARPSCSGCALQGKNVETLKTQMHMLRALVTDSLEEVKRMTEKMDSFTVEMKSCVADLRSERAEINGENTSLFLKYKITFPLSSLEDVHRFEEILKNERDFDNGVNELAKFGGSNGYDFTKRTLTAIISNDIALQYSWLGRKGKEPFNMLQLARLIIVAAEKAKIHTSRKETESNIQVWLKRAADRKAAISKKF